MCCGCPGVTVTHPVDRFGVGDAFAAGYVSGLIQGKDGPDAVDLGNRVAGWSLQLPGNIESLPTRKELEGVQETSELTRR